MSCRRVLCHKKPQKTPKKKNEKAKKKKASFALCAFSRHHLKRSPNRLAIRASVQGNLHTEDVECQWISSLSMSLFFRSINVHITLARQFEPHVAQFNACERNPKSQIEEHSINPVSNLTRFVKNAAHPQR
jgi:hypothetical protein